jgi:hypothetical protein
MLAETLPKLPLNRACFRRWAPNKQKPAQAIKAPANMPGKKPARIAPTGNALQSACTVDGLVWVAEGFAVTAGAVGGTDVLDKTETTVGVDVPVMELVCDGAEP